MTVEHVKQRADAALFIMSRPGDLFEAIEAPAAVTGLPIVRAGREIDPQLFRSRDLGFLNGHVPVTGILSAIAVLAAVLDGRDAVIMSNEWSASIPTMEVDGRPINHQYSKSAAFEAAFRAVLAGSLGTPLSYFSELRPFTELWVALRFAGLTQYHGTFRSCNRAFHLDPVAPPRPLVRPLRQVLLHRPDPGAVRPGGRAGRDLRRPRAAGRPGPG